MALTKLNNQSLSAVTSAGIPIRSGSVLQVLNTTFNTQVATTSQTPSATGLAQTITPNFANSKLLVHIDASVYNNTASKGVDLYLYRDGSAVTLVSGTAGGRFAYVHSYNTGGQSITSSSFSFLADAGSTSATTFQLYFANGIAGGTAYVNVNGASDTAAITVMEIAG
jgi:hypothetical protein